MKPITPLTIFASVVFVTSSCTKTADYNCKCAINEDGVEMEENYLIEDKTEEDASATCQSFNTVLEFYTKSCELDL